MYLPSGYFRNLRTYAEATGERWRILSAKHGLLHPDETIEPYDERGISETQAQVIAVKLQGEKRVEIHAGMGYTAHLIPELSKRGIKVDNPCQGMKIGKRREWLQTETKKLKNKTLC